MSATPTTDCVPGRKAKDYTVDAVNDKFAYAHKTLKECGFRIRMQAVCWRRASAVAGSETSEVGSDFPVAEAKAPQCLA